MIDFPRDESLMTCGLDAWPQSVEECPQEIKIVEERLQLRLGVSHFRFPPEYRDPGPGIRDARLRLPFVRFPGWHYCPRCGEMVRLSIFGGRQRCSGPNYAEGLSCHATTPNRRPWLIPVRFIAICGRGHIEDFPFMEWVHRVKHYDETHRLRLRAGRSSSALSGMVISCSCGDRRSMAGSFNRNSLDAIRVCGGHRPWLGEIEDGHRPCGRQLQVVQRGASNVYFPEIRNSIYLPQWESSLERKLVEVLDKHWSYLTSSLVNGKLDTARFQAIGDLYKVDYRELMKAATKRRATSFADATAQIDSEELYRKSEYDAIVSGFGGDNQDFFVTQRDIREYGTVINKYFDRVSLIHKLRETRTLVGFSRWLPEDGRSLQEKKADMALNSQIDWLPAIVVRGEGIFLELSQSRLKEWIDKHDEVKSRTRLLVRNLNRARGNRGQPDRVLNPRFLLLHTFAHILINQLSFECGYGSSAIRERIYCNTESEDRPMNGVLIYTASGDSEGSLGGLVRQGNPGNIERVIIAALNSARWCSSDPVCMQSRGQGPDSCNLAACHSCALLPETSCEEGNRLLDRALMVGSFAGPDGGFFAGFDEK